ncbi:response regulator [Bifidobacterium stellenboschense]|uniref:LuxR family transcriptional regulator n=1 Tax=Bifidobacterium stellenboschense TaxID=762211 RepID=A0A087DIA1_9BIFI|nr:response regulator [Bifidobacterium stellenboschense]KFI95251.1 LuxR family transcriptional regulator [Bifidobacterium stellenboschense]
MSVITIGIVDNDVITVKALAALLERNDDFHVIWTASSGRQTIVNCLEDERWPDVLLVDAELGDDLGTEVCRRLRAGNGACAMLVITAYPPERYRRDAARAGAQGIVGKADYPWLERAIRFVHAGRVFAVPTPRREGADMGNANVGQLFDSGRVPRWEGAGIGGVDDLGEATMRGSCRRGRRSGGCLRGSADPLVSVRPVRVRPLPHRG